MIFKRMFNTTKKIVINLAVLVGTLVICFIVAEIGVRTAKVNIPQVQGYTITLDNAWGNLGHDVNVINPIPPTIGRAGYAPHPYIGLTGPLYRDSTVDQFGHVISHAPDVCNIGLLGGSGAMYFAEYEKKVGALTQFLSKKYHDSRCKTFAVVNLALGGSYAPSQLYFFLQNLDVLDLVVVIDGNNEVTSGLTSPFLWPVDWPPHMYYQDFLYLGVRGNLESGIQIQLFKGVYEWALRVSRRLETGSSDEPLVRHKLYTNLGTPGIDDSQTTIPLNTTQGLPLKGIVTLGREQIFYTGISGNSLTGATRGANNTAAIAHAAGSWVTSDAAIVQTDQGNEFGYWLGHSKLLRYLSALLVSYTNQRMVDLQQEQLEKANPKEKTKPTVLGNYVNHYAHLKKAWETIRDDSNSIEAQYWRPKMGWNKGNQSIADFGREHAKEDNEVLLGQYIESISQNDLRKSAKTHMELMSETRQYRQKIWARSALLLQQIATRFNIPIVHALQPVLLPGVKTLTPLETSYGFDQNVRQSYSDYDSYIKELQLLGVRIHDFRNIFINFSGDAFIDTVHLTEAGNKIMSDRLIEVMEASLPATLQADDRAPSKIDWNLLYK